MVFAVSAAVACLFMICVVASVMSVRALDQPAGCGSPLPYGATEIGAPLTGFWERKVLYAAESAADLRTGMYPVCWPQYAVTSREARYLMKSQEASCFSGVVL